MNEAYVGSKTRQILRERGFFILKHADKSTIGIPDMSIHKNGKTLWVEEKLIYCNEDDIEKIGESLVLIVHPKEFIVKDRMTQLNTMLNLERNSLAEYWIYVRAQKKTFIAKVSPKIVFNNIRADQTIVFNLHLLDEFRINFSL